VVRSYDWYLMLSAHADDCYWQENMGCLAKVKLVKNGMNIRQEHE
jgi:hypothetical protein